jgi:hypothetical protein
MPFDKGFAETLCSQLTSNKEECVKYMTTQSPRTSEEFLSDMERITGQSRERLILKLKECQPCKAAKERIQAQARKASSSGVNIGLVLLGVGIGGLGMYLIYKGLKRK